MHTTLAKFIVHFGENFGKNFGEENETIVSFTLHNRQICLL